MKVHLLYRLFSDNELSPLIERAISDKIVFESIKNLTKKGLADFTQFCYSEHHHDWKLVHEVSIWLALLEDQYEIPILVRALNHEIVPNIFKHMYSSSDKFEALNLETEIARFAILRAKTALRSSGNPNLITLVKKCLIVLSLRDKVLIRNLNLRSCREIYNHVVEATLNDFGIERC